MSWKNIIFDLGAVIIDIDYNKTADAFKALGIKDFDDIYSKARQEQLFDEFEKGNLHAEAFREKIRSHIPAFTSNEKIDKAWNAMLIGFPEQRIVWLKKIASRYRIFLLSNTNSIHVEEFTRMADQKFGAGVFEKIFEKVYYSCNVHMRKPDAEIFESVISENNLSVKDTLFIDDSIQHVEGAIKFGLHAELLNMETGEKVEEKYCFL